MHAKKVNLCPHFFAVRFRSQKVDRIEVSKNGSNYGSALIHTVKNPIANGLGVSNGVGATGSQVLGLSTPGVTVGYFRSIYALIHDTCLDKRETLLVMDGMVEGHHATLIQL